MLTVFRHEQAAFNLMAMMMEKQIDRPPSSCTVARMHPDLKQQPPAASREDALRSEIATALECPCVKDLKEGKCGKFFVQAFTCYHLSQDVIKGADCFKENVAFAVRIPAGAYHRHSSCCNPLCY